MNRRKTISKEYIDNHGVVYFFILVLFLIGIIFGAVIVNSMDFKQKQDLLFYLDRFFGQLLEGPLVHKQDMLKSTIFYHITYMLLLFVLGLSVIGMPVIWILLFIKGLVVGFSVGFFVNAWGWQGLIFATASIAPQNLIIIPIYLVAGSLAMIFSLTLLRKIFARRVQQQPILQPLIQYASTFVVLIVALSLASVIETFIANEAMEVVIRWIYS